jgi:hypothetical protein
VRFTPAAPPKNPANVCCFGGIASRVTYDMRDGV